MAGQVVDNWRRQWGPRLCYDLHWQKPCLRRRGRKQRWVRRIAPVTQPSEDQIGIHRIALRNLSNRNTRCRRLETDRPLLFIRPKPLRPPRHAITKVPTIDHGHYPTLSTRGSAVRPDAYLTAGLLRNKMYIQRKPAG